MCTDTINKSQFKKLMCQSYREGSIKMELASDSLIRDYKLPFKTLPNLLTSRLIEKKIFFNYLQKLFSTKD